MLAIELVDPATSGPTDRPRTPAAAQAIAKACHDAGLLVLTCGTYGNVLRFLPPLVMPTTTPSTVDLDHPQCRPRSGRRAESWRR